MSRKTTKLKLIKSRSKRDELFKSCNEIATASDMLPTVGPIPLQPCNRATAALTAEKLMGRLEDASTEGDRCQAVHGGCAAGMC